MTGKGSRSLSQRRFGEFAQGYVTSPAHAQVAELDRLVAIAQPQPDWIVLDVATGGGHTALTFAPFVARVIAIDITPQMLDQAAAFIAGRGDKNVTFALADAEDLPFDDETFDLVTCRIAPHHFPDCARFVQEGARVLRSAEPAHGKPAGLLLVQDRVLPEDPETACYINAFERLRDPSHNRACAESEWVRMFQETGLKVERREQVVKRHLFLRWAERQGCTPSAIERLAGLVEKAPESVVAWMEPHAFGTPDAAFSDHHLIIAGQKPGSKESNHDPDEQESIVPRNSSR